MLHIKFIGKIYYCEVSDILNCELIYKPFALKLFGKYKNCFDAFFLYQYLFNYDNLLNITYPNTRVFVWARDC